MADEYSIKFFKDHYIEHREIADVHKELVEEAFMGGAHTVMLMVTNILAMEDPKPLLRKMAQELNEFMVIKNAEEEFKNATVH